MPKSVDTNIQVLPSGLVLNNEVDLPAAPGLPTDNKYSVNWFSLTNGARLAYITGDRGDADTTQINIQAVAENDLVHSTAGINLTAIRTPTGFGQVSASVEDPTNGISAPIIIRSDGSSGFLTAGPGHLGKSKGGTGTFALVAVNQATVTIAGLGFTPVGILLTNVDPGSVGSADGFRPLTYDLVGAGTFRAKCVTFGGGAVTANVPFSWFAWS